MNGINLKSIKGCLEDERVWLKMMMLLFFVIIYAFIFSGLAKGAVALFGVTDKASVLKVTQLFQSSGMFLAAPLTTAFLITKRSLADYLSLKNFPHLLVVLFTVASVWFVMPWVNVVGELNKSLSLPDSMKMLEEVMRQMEDAAEKVTQMILVTDSFFQYCLNLLIVALLPAVGEELLFRGVLQNTLERNMKNSHVAIWVTAAIFSFIHFQFFGFVPRLLLGAYLGYLLYWSRSLFLPIVAHFVNNATIVTLYYMYADDLEKLEQLESGGNYSKVFLLISMLAFVVAVAFVFIRRKRDAEKS